MVRREIPCDDHVSVEPIKVKRQTRRTPEELVNQSLLLIERVGLGMAATDFCRKRGDRQKCILQTLVVNQLPVECCEILIHLSFAVVAIQTGMKLFISAAENGCIRKQISRFQHDNGRSPRVTD